MFIAKFTAVVPRSAALREKKKETTSFDIRRITKKKENLKNAPALRQFGRD